MMSNNWKKKCPEISIYVTSNIYAQMISKPFLYYQNFRSSNCKLPWTWWLVCTKRFCNMLGVYVSSLSYSLGTGESYGPTVQHTQDCPIFFIQLNYVHNKRNKVMPPYATLPCHKVAPKNSISSFSIQPFCIAVIFGHSCLYLLKSPFNTWHPSFIFVGLCWFVSIGMHLGIF